MSEVNNGRQAGAKPESTAHSAAFVSRLTVAYTAALTILGVLAWLEHMVMQANIRSQASDAAIVSVSERQRMLVQRVALCSLGLVYAQDNEVRQRFRKELSELSDVIDRSHRGLISGDPKLNLPSEMSLEVRDMYFSPPLSLDTRIRGFVTNVRDLVQQSTEGLNFQDPKLANIVSDSTQLLGSYERLVLQLRDESEEGIARLERLESLLLSLTITVLVATAVFIFRPLVRRMRSELRERELAEQSLRESEAEAKELAAQLAHYSGELERSNKDLEQFAAIASHDLQEPLRSITSFTEILRRRLKGQLEGQSQEYMESIVSGARRMKVLIDDLLNLSRISTSQTPFELVDLNEIVKQVCQDLATQISEKKALIDIRGLPRLSADPSQVRQLMQNLIGNAIKFGKPGELPRVKVSARLLPPQHRHAPELWELCVEDDGIGFSPEYKEAIFQIFHRLHGRTQYEGTGIGLAVCKKIVERHGGTIRAESECGKGARFFISLPERQPIPPAGIAKPAA